MNEPIAWKTTKGALAFCDAKYGKEQGWTPLYACTNAEKTYEDAIEDCAQRAEAYAYMSPNFTALAEELRAILKKANEK